MLTMTTRLVPRNVTNSSLGIAARLPQRWKGDFSETIYGIKCRHAVIRLLNRTYAIIQDLKTASKSSLIAYIPVSCQALHCKYGVFPGVFQLHYVDAGLLSFFFCVSNYHINLRVFYGHYSP